LSFSPRNLSVLAYANGFTLWHYKTRDRLADVGDDRYFGSAADLLANGDMVMVTAADGARFAAASVAAGACRLAPVN
jgi:outer membrane protein assembly factor BamB